MEKTQFVSKLSQTKETYKGATDSKLLRMENIAVKALVSQFGVKEAHEAVEGDEELAKYLESFVSSSAFETKDEEIPAEETKEEVKTEVVAETAKEEEDKNKNEELFKLFKKKHKEAQLKRGKVCFSGYRFFYNEDGKFILEDVTAGTKVDFKEDATVDDVLNYFAPKKVEREPAGEKESLETPAETARKEVLDLIEKGEAGNMALVDALSRKDKRKAKEFLATLQDGKITQDKFLDELRNICEGRYDEKKETKKPKKVELPEEEEIKSAYDFPKYTTVGQLIGDKIEVDGEKVNAVPFLAQWLLAFEPRLSKDLFKLSQGDIDWGDMLQPYQDGEIPSAQDLDVNLLPNNAKLAQEITYICRYLLRFAPQDVVYIADTDLAVGETLHLLACCQDKQKSKPTAVVEDETGLGMLTTEKYGVIYKTDVWFKHVNPVKE